MKKLLLSALVLLSALTAQAQTDGRSLFVHLTSGATEEIACSEIDSITFASFDLSVKATQSYGVYNGLSSDSGAGQYTFALSDGEMDEEAGPTTAGQTVVIFYAFADNSASTDLLQLPSGTYTNGEDFTAGTLYNGRSGYLHVSHCTDVAADGTVNGWSVDLGYGTLKVKNDAGQYQIDFQGGISERSEEYNFKDIHVTYTGGITFENNDPSFYQPVSQDYAVVPTGMTGTYMTGSDDDGNEYGNYSLAFFNAPMDEDGYFSGAGECLGVELLTQADETMNVESIVGEYTITDINDGPFTAGHFLSGCNMDYYGSYWPMGTYLSFMDEDGYTTQTYGFATGGTVKVTADGDQLTYTVDLEVEGGHKVTMTYTADSSLLEDYTSYYSLNAPRAQKGQTGVRTLKAMKLQRRASGLRAIRAVKK